MTEEEVLGKKPLRTLERVRSGVTRMVAIALVVIIVVGGVVGTYIAFRSPSSSPTPTPTLSAPPSPSPAPTSTPTPTPTTTPTQTPTPTPSPTPAPTFTHTVDWTTMANYQTDFWSITVTNPYTVTLNDSMTVSSGDQWLTITAYGTSSSIWSVVFMNQTCFEYRTTIPVVGGCQYDSGYLGCDGGIVQVVVSGTAITYTGTISHVSNVTFTIPAQIQTLNGDGNFNGGELDTTLTQ